MKCPSCGFEVGPFANAAATVPLVHNCVLPTNAAVAMPLTPVILFTPNAIAAAAPQFSGFVCPVLL